MEEIKLSITIPVKASEIYKAWLNSKGHTLFTGGEANISNKKNALFTAWDGYISGKNLELIKDKFIKQNWRTVEFNKNWPDSILEITLTETAGKTKLDLFHYGLQKGDGKKYKEGWKQHYFEPMKEFYTK